MNFPRYKLWLLLGALLGCLAVALGAFGAHGLETALESQRQMASGLSEAEIAKKLANWETAARYQMYHALALVGVGLLASRRCGRAINLAGVAFTLGTLIFSGCLYALVLTGHKWLGAVVPLGGAFLIVGWICLAVAVWRHADPTSAARVVE
jgi:uncharacterized membrane protein YgdD (TMEM256/DUF423 family)